MKGLSRIDHVGYGQRCRYLWIGLEGEGARTCLCKEKEHPLSNNERLEEEWFGTANGVKLI